jgi:NADH:ubiquinone oxidoreductase subunit 6 (subunit J)
MPDGMFLSRLATVLPRVRNKLAVAGVLISVAGFVATRSVDPDAVHAQVSAGAIGVLFLIFGQVFHHLASFPEGDRLRLITRLFGLFVILVLALLVITGLFLQSRSPVVQAIVPPPAFDVRDSRLPILTDQLDNEQLPTTELTAMALAAREGRMSRQFGPSHRQGYPEPRKEEAAYIQHRAEEALDIQTGGFVRRWRDALLQVALVGHGTGVYVIESLYLKLHAYAPCSLRDEYEIMQAPALVPSYAFYISPMANVYEIVDRTAVGQKANWRIKGGESEQFSIRLEYPPYSLFVITVNAEVRNEGTGESFRLRSPYYPLVRVENGNTGGCLELADWYSPSILQRPVQAYYRPQNTDLFSYQIMTLDSENDRTFLLKAVNQLPQGQLNEDLLALKLISANQPENSVLARNVDWLQKLIQWRSSNSSVDPP